MSKDIEDHILSLYKVDRLLGSGAYGHVWRVVDRKTHQQLALKKIFDAFQNSTDAQRTYRQITVLNELDHPNIIKLDRVIRAYNNKDLYLVFEYMESDLHSVVGEGVLETVHHKYIFYQIMRALKYLHSAELIHRDLKPSNILINSQCQVKLCDFGLVRSVFKSEDNEALVLSQQVATRWYRSPEVLLGSKSYGKPADLWSVGCIVAEMITGQPLFPGNNTLDQLERILAFTGRPSQQDIDSLQNPLVDQLISQVHVKRKDKKQIFKNVPPAFVKVIEGLLQFNPRKRLTVDQLLLDPLLDEFHSQFEQTVCESPIVPEVDDNIRLGLKKYRDIIYSDIEARYPSCKSFKSAKADDKKRTNHFASGSPRQCKKKNSPLQRKPSGSINQVYSPTLSQTKKPVSKSLKSRDMATASYKQKCSPLHNKKKKDASASVFQTGVIASNNQNPQTLTHASSKQPCEPTTVGTSLQKPGAVKEWSKSLSKNATSCSTNNLLVRQPTYAKQLQHQMPTPVLKQKNKGTGGQLIKKRCGDKLFQKSRKTLQGRLTFQQLHKMYKYLK